MDIMPDPNMQAVEARRRARPLLGDTWQSDLGFRWRWIGEIADYLCDTPECGAREADAHTEKCCAAARARSGR